MVRRSEKGSPADNDERKERHVDGADADDVLWAKYLDYCSARVCDAFVGLQEERVFELAQDAQRESGLSNGQLSFREIAALLVDKMLGELSLPDFDVWVVSYKENPSQYEEHLLGLWKKRAQVGAR